MVVNFSVQSTSLLSPYPQETTSPLCFPPWPHLSQVPRAEPPGSPESPYHAPPPPATTTITTTDRVGVVDLLGVPGAGGCVADH